MWWWSCGWSRRFLWLSVGAGSAKERIVNSLYCVVNAQHNRACFCCNKVAVLQLSVIRRQNVLALFQLFAEAALAQGRPTKGLEQEFAAVLAVAPSMWSQIKSGRPIGDKLARQFERAGNKPKGWLDEEHEQAPMPTPAEEAFVKLARQAWRAQNARGKRELRRVVESFPEAP